MSKTVQHRALEVHCQTEEDAETLRDILSRATKSQTRQGMFEHNGEWEAICVYVPLDLEGFVGDESKFIEIFQEIGDTLIEQIDNNVQDYGLQSALDNMSRKD